MKALLTLFAVFLLLPTAAATVTMDIASLPPAVAPFTPFPGSLEFLFDDVVPADAEVKAFIDAEFQSSLPISDIIDPAIYSFTTHTFSYNLTSQGTNTWSTSPPQTFTSTITATGTCGGSYCFVEGTDICALPGDPNACPCSTPGSYPCVWSTDFTIPQSSVSGDEGLTFIYNVLDSIALPFYNNPDDTIYTVSTDNPSVTTVMHAACGNGAYAGKTATSQGWIVRQILDSELSDIGGTADKSLTIPPFNDASLSPPGNTLYNPLIPGGVYKDDVYQNFGTGVEWFGPDGHILIHDYLVTSDYFVAFLPPNGPHLCAFTDDSQTFSAAWDVGIVHSGTVRYDTPYSRMFLPSELPQPPACPPEAQSCTQQTLSTNAIEVTDPSGTVSILFDDVTFTASATTSDSSLPIPQTASVPLASFPSLLGPAQPGIHQIDFSLEDESILAITSTPFSVCKDLDSDGFCAKVDDCDDNNTASHPGGIEMCDGSDNDCDGEIDEDFDQLFQSLGNPCGIPMSACGGVIVCTLDGTNTTCSGTAQPGDFPEYCADGIDNDCDGDIDETLELTGKVACVCKDGDIRPCGSNIGICSSGLQTCSGGTWGACSAPTPQTELCNRLDDNCDGIVDNVLGATSAQSAACQCYGGASPTLETCNDIDDDCDGLVDENMQCCSDGDIRSCGSSTGICSPGTQQCVVGTWGFCQGGVQPGEEICYNSLDDNCDGQVDEFCSPDFTCFNGIQDLNEDGIDCGGECDTACGFDPFYLYFIAIGLIFLVGAVMIQLRLTHV